jgi:cobyrinic acid a,c-diamide synthase
MIAGTGSDVGKTFVTVGIIENLIKKGYKVQAYKVGPDYIDPQHHWVASGRPSKNLDSYLMSKEEILEIFCKSSSNVDVSVVEGVRGLYEGPYFHNQIGSTAHVAKILKIPVILVVNARGLNRSIAAILKGFKEFDPNIDIRGVILNNVMGKRHEEKIVRAIKWYLNLEVLGSISFKKDYMIEKRHLGLITPDISGDRFLRNAKEAVKEYVNMDRLEEIAFHTHELNCSKAFAVSNLHGNLHSETQNVTMGIVYNSAFNFYYAEFLERLKTLGVKLYYIDVLSDETAEVDGLYIGGGYPEIFAKELEKNRKSKKWIKNLIEEEKPIYAECGGLIYLTQKIIMGNNQYKMVGGIPCETIMSGKRHLSLTRLKTLENTITGPKNTLLKGHEFHYTEVANLPRDIKFAYEMRRGFGLDGKHDGIIEKSILASYTHLYLGSWDHCSHFVRYMQEAAKV